MADDPRTVVITGASSGIGLAAAEALARRGDHLVLVGRDPARLRAAAERVRAAGGKPPAEFRADFAVLDEVRGLAAELLAAYPRIDVLANNAGLIAPRRVTTVDGHELTIQTNHLAGFLLTDLLHERVDRVITTASGAEAMGRLDPAELSPSKFSSWIAYGSSKQANILFTVEAAKRWPSVLPTCFHPGTVRTMFGRDSAFARAFYRFVPFLRTPEKGAETLVWLATAPASETPRGGYFIDRRRRRPRPHSTDPALATALWEASKTAVGVE